MASEGKILLEQRYFVVAEKRILGGPNLIMAKHI